MQGLFIMMLLDEGTWELNRLVFSLSVDNHLTEEIRLYPQP